MATCGFDDRLRLRKIKLSAVVGHAASPLFDNFATRRAVKHNIIRIAIIDDFSGPNGSVGERVAALFEDYAKTTNAKGEYPLGQGLIRLRSFDTIVPPAGQGF